MKTQIRAEHVVGGVLVAALHAAALWGLASHRLIALPPSTPTLFVDLIAPQAQVTPRPVPLAPAEPRPQRTEPPRPSEVVSSAAQGAPGDPALPLPAVAPVIAVAPAPTRAGPVALAGELAVACPERSAPDYPLAARRRNETGTALLHVELDEKGQVVAATVLESSGHPRLDEAALAAVRRWRCTSAQRHGQAVRATARQAFNFVLQGN
jgi:protein TonB